MRLVSNVWLSMLLVAAVACGNGNKPGPDAPAADIGFNKPKASLKANTEVSTNMWMELGAADLSCLGTPSADVATTTAVTLTTRDDDFQSGNPVPGELVTVFKDQDSAHPFDTQTTDANAMVTVTLPINTKRFGFKMSGSGTLDTLLLNQLVDPGMATQTLTRIQSVSMTTAQTLPALIGVSRTPGTGVLAGALRDCQKHELSNFIAMVSSTPATATSIDGEDAYYFNASAGLPVRHSQQDAGSKNGIFMVIELPPTATAYVQMWGYKDDAALAADHLELISQLQTEVLPDTVITGSYEPLRTQ